jgi:hypothetical protein
LIYSHLLYIYLSVFAFPLFPILVVLFNLLTSLEKSRKLTYILNRLELTN